MPPPRVLFLDDDPRRAEIFLAEHPQAVWVETVVDCVERLGETWDEVHLDHDLGGRQHVGVDDIDCGMEVIRWMCKEPRDHLRATQFFVHTHNMVAGLLMVMQMRSSGFKAEFQPFGQDLASVLAHNEPRRKLRTRERRPRRGRRNVGPGGPASCDGREERATLRRLARRAATGRPLPGGKRRIVNSRPRIVF